MTTTRTPRHSRWQHSAERAKLMALYREADALLDGWSCACTPDGAGRPAIDCCHFEVIGREPHPTAVELEEVRHAIGRHVPGLFMSAAGAVRKLPLVGSRPCPLLSAEGRCRIYASRPFGCRTFFCRGAEPPLGVSSRSLRAALHAVGRRIADLSERFAPRDPHPRPLVRALALGVHAVADGRRTQDR